MDPKGAGHLFLVHGQACLKSAARPQCSFEGGSAPPAKMFVIDVKELMAGDWRVSWGRVDAFGWLAGWQRGWACLPAEATWGAAQCALPRPPTPNPSWLPCSPLPLLCPQDCNAASGSADYEEGAVPKPDTCLLGAKYSLQRRKRDAGCFNTGSYSVNVTQKEACTCSLADTGGWVGAGWLVGPWAGHAAGC